MDKFRICVLVIIIGVILFGIAAIGTNILNDSEESDVVDAYNKEAVHLPVSIKELIKVLTVKREEVPEGFNVIDESISMNETDEDQPPVETEPTNDTKLYVWKELRKAGFSPAAAAGVMGNIEEEHHFQTSDTPNGLGICQWIGGRKTECMTWCSNMGVEYTSIEGQTSFAINELKTSNQPIGSYLSKYLGCIQRGYELLGESYKEPHQYSSLDEYMNTSDVDSACLSVMGRFERCSPKQNSSGFYTARVNERLHSARVLYETYKGVEV